MPIVDNNENIITKALTSSGDNISYILDNSNNIIIDFRRSVQGLILDSQDTIASRSNADTAANYYSVGDRLQDV